MVHNIRDDLDPYTDMVDVHPRFFMYTLSLYFTTYSLASVGYGDLVPGAPPPLFCTPLSKKPLKYLRLY
jgi:hypothetical protein